MKWKGQAELGRGVVVVEGDFIWFDFERNNVNEFENLKLSKLIVFRV